VGYMLGNHMKKKFSRKFLVFGVGACIIFLTACARRGYHTPLESRSLPSQIPFKGYAAQGVGGERLVWPLEGQVVVPFGGREENISVKGIVIQAAEGARVVAAEGGRVSFVDENLKGYGRTVIIEHGAGFATVYARNSEILVAPGQWVRQGEAIAKAGTSGRGLFPQLYFEVRRNAKAEDPLRYLVR